MTRYRALLGCAAIAVMVALGFPSLTARASDGTEPIAEPAATGDATSDQQTGEPVVNPDPPADPVAPPADPVAPPADPVAPPADPVAPPADPSPPADPVAPPADPVAPPADPVALPADPVPAPAGPVATESTTLVAAPTSAVSADTSMAVAVSAPSVPLSPKAVPGNASATVYWAVPTSTGGSPIAGYTIYYPRSGGTWSSINVAASARSRVFTGLTNGTAYYFRVAAYSTVGGSPTTASVTAVPRTVPSVPRSFTATAGYAQATLRWAAPASTGGSPITGYTISYAPSGGTWTSVNVSASTRSRTITSLRGGATYYFRISAYNVAGRSPSTPSVRAIPIAYGKPGAGAIHSVTNGNRSVGLRWSPPTNTGGLPITRYVVQIGTNGVWRNLVTLPSTTSAYTATGLVNGRTYYFRVAAANRLGWGAWSPSVRAVPVAPPAPPAPPPARTCDPNYSGCVPIASDVDCAGGSGNGPAYVQGPVYVIGYDIYGLDSDNDGVGCEG